MLKVLFGKNGVMDLLSNAFVTTKNISKFDILTKTLHAQYISLKLKSLNDSAKNLQAHIKQANENFNQLDEINSLGQTGWQILGNAGLEMKKQIRELNREIQYLRDEEAHGYNIATCGFVGATDTAINDRPRTTTGTIFQGLSFLGAAAYGVKKAEKAREALDEAENEKYNISREVNGTFKILYSEINAIKKDINGVKVDIEKNKDAVNAFIVNCRKLGGTYEKEKHTNFLSFRTNKLKKETARILSKLLTV